ncbi:C39 family peptidase [Methanolobus sp. ZRKC5]|uniref:C39 family peptidase n=1 Tax=unclassified Methanolobus TaxID=2629569 RepID=UPI00313DFAE0
MSGSGDPEIIRRNSFAFTAKVIATITFVVILLICNIAPTEGITENTSSSANKTLCETTILPVPYCNQGDTNWCLYYCLSMMFNYNNHQIEPWKMAEYFDSGHSDTFSGQYNPYDNSLEDYSKQSASLSTRKTVWGYNLGNFNADNFNALIKDNIDRGQPILMAFQYEVSDGIKKGHAIIAVGYDEEYIYLTDPSGATTRDLFGIKGRYIAVPVNWCDFNDKLVSKIAPTNMAFTIEILNEAPDNSPMGSIYMTDLTNNDYSCLNFANRNNPEDVGLLRYDGRYEGGYHIIQKGNSRIEREISSLDSISIYFSVSNPTTTQKDYVVKSNLINKNTEEVLDSFFFKIDLTVNPFDNISKGINYSNQLESVPSDKYSIMLTLFDENMNIVDSICLDIHIT